jgi:Xaa-Pro dipeptidase
MDLQAIQSALRAAHLDGWLFYDFHNRDHIAARILKMDTKRFASRRWFYFIPAQGEPQKLVHRIEPWRCDHLPGAKHIYLPWPEQHGLLKEILGPAKNIAMQYSPDNAIPYVSIVDGGTLELIRGFGIKVTSSADLVGQFEAHISMDDWKTHQDAGQVMQMVKDQAFLEIGRRIKAGQSPREIEIQNFMLNIMKEHNVIAEDGPIVAVNEHAADPHFEPTETNSLAMKMGDLVLLDLWAKKNVPGSIYYDITWMGFIGESVPEQHESIFQIICQGRDEALKCVQNHFNTGKPLHGWQVDDVCRKVIVDAGYGEYFTHRTGHNIGENVHGNGVHIDNLETKDERRILAGSCFSVEPGIYLLHEKRGYRTEIDVVVTEEGRIDVTGAIQKKIVPILSL